MNSRVNYGITYALIGGIIGTIASVWMLLNPPNFFDLGTIIDFLYNRSGMFSDLYDYTSFPQMSTYWLLIGFLGLIDSIIIYVLTLAIISKKFPTRINRIAILLLILGVVDVFIFAIGWYLHINIGYNHFQQLTFIFLTLYSMAGSLAGIGGALIWTGLKPEKLA